MVIGFSWGHRLGWLERLVDFYENGYEDRGVGCESALKLAEHKEHSPG